MSSKVRNGFSGRSRELLLRTVTGLLGAGFLIGFISWGGLPAIQVVALGLTLLTLFEFSGMTLSLSDRKLKTFFLLLVGLSLHLVFFLTREWVFLPFAFLSLFAFFLFLTPKHAENRMQRHAEELMISFFGLVYLGLLPLFLIELRAASDLPHLTILYFFMIWATDIGAYFAGVTLGKTKLFPSVSPKKSVEGLVGGVLFALFIVFLYRHLFETGWDTKSLALVTVLISLFSQVGDLCESFLKRAFEKKDSSSLLPGHGGFLDRFDGFIFTLPVMVACLPMLR